MTGKKQEKTEGEKPVGKKTTKPKIADRQKEENIEKVVIDLAKKGYSPAKIGEILKQKQEIKKIKVLGKSITKILKENNISYENDLAIVNKKIKKLEEHYNKNKQDKRAKRELVKFIGLRKKLEKYNSKNKK